MMGKSTHLRFSPYFTILLVCFSLLTVASVAVADTYNWISDDQQLLIVNATWPSGARLEGSDSFDGNMSNPTSMNPFRDGPPTIHLSVTDDDVDYREDYIEITNANLLSSKYIVMLLLYNTTQYGNDVNTTTVGVWTQGNMTVSTSGGVVAGNQTYVTLTNDTQPLLEYDLVYYQDDPWGTPFDTSIWQLSVNVVQQTPELEKYLRNFTLETYKYDTNITMNETYEYRLAGSLDTLYGYLDYGDGFISDLSELWNGTAPCPWGRIYCYAPGIFNQTDETPIATPTASSSSVTGGSSGGASATSPSGSTATTSQAAAIKQAVIGGPTAGILFFLPWLISALSISLFL